MQERAEAAEEAFLAVFAYRRMNSRQSAYNLVNRAVILAALHSALTVLWPGTRVMLAPSVSPLLTLTRAREQGLYPRLHADTEAELDLRT